MLRTPLSMEQPTTAMTCSWREMATGCFTEIHSEPRCNRTRHHPDSACDGISEHSQCQVVQSPLFVLFLFGSHLFSDLWLVGCFLSACSNNARESSISNISI